MKLEHLVKHSMKVALFSSGVIFGLWNKDQIDDFVAYSQIYQQQPHPSRAEFDITTVRPYENLATVVDFCYEVNSYE